MRLHFLFAVVLILAVAMAVLREGITVWRTGESRMAAIVGLMPAYSIAALVATTRPVRVGRRPIAAFVRGTLLSSLLLLPTPLLWFWQGLYELLGRLCLQIDQAVLVALASPGRPVRSLVEIVDAVALVWVVFSGPALAVGLLNAASVNRSPGHAEVEEPRSLV